MPPESQTPQSTPPVQTPAQDPTPPATPPTPPTPTPTPPVQQPTVGGPYKKHSIWVMVLVYVLLAAVIYGVVYWFFLR